MEQRDLKDYIVKLNDRNIQRQRESGFTLYAVAAGIIYCVFFLIDNIKITYDIKNSINLNVCIFTANFLLIMSLFFAAYSASKNKAFVNKIFPYQQPFSIDIEDSLLLISYAIVGCLNFFCLKHYDGKLHSLFFIVFGTVALSNVASPFIIKGYRFYNKWKKKRNKQSSELIDFTFKSEISKGAAIGLTIYGIVFGTFYFYFWLKTMFDIDAATASIIIKFTVCFFSLLYLIKIAISIHEKQQFNHTLEEFEKEIFFDNITNEQIANKYESIFFGIPISRWLSFKQIEILNFFDKKRQEFILQTARLISQNDDLGNCHYIVQSVKEEQLKILDDSKDFVQMVNSNFVNLSKFGSLNDKEIDELSNVQMQLNQEISGFNLDYKQLSKKIQKQSNENKKPH